MRYWQAAKEKSLSIGVYPKVTLSDARKKREELRKQLQADLDPSAERKAANLRKKLFAENSFEAVALEISNNTLLFALYRLGYKGKMTGHGFRAVASTILNEAGFKPDVIERQLAHCERNQVRGAYNRAEYLPERKRMMQHWADYLNVVEAGAKVIPMHGGAA